MVYYLREIDNKASARIIAAQKAAVTRMRKYLALESAALKRVFEELSPASTVSIAARERHSFAFARGLIQHRAPEIKKYRLDDCAERLSSLCEKRISEENIKASA